MIFRQRVQIIDLYPLLFWLFRDKNNHQLGWWYKKLIARKRPPMIGYDNCKTYHFDPRSENLGEFQGGTYDFLFDEDYEDVIEELIDASNAEIRSMTREQKEEKGGIWESTFTEVVDVTEQTIEVRFFENEALRFKVTMDGTEHLPALEAPVFSELPPYDYFE